MHSSSSLKKRIFVSFAVLLLVSITGLFIFKNQPLPSHKNTEAKDSSRSAHSSIIQQKQIASLNRNHVKKNNIPPLKALSKQAAPPTSQQINQAIQPFDQWLKNIKQQNDLTPDTIQKGVKLAQLRRPIMLSLIQKDPEAALAHAINWADYKKLPQEIKKWVETPFSTRGDYLVLPHCQSHKKTVQGSSYEVLINGSPFQSTAYGRRKDLSSKENTPLQGILLDHLAAVRSAPLQKLTPDEFNAIKKDFPLANKNQTRGFSSGKKITSSPVVALGGGMLFYFYSETELQKTNKKLEKLDNLPGPHSGAQLLFLEADGDGSTKNANTGIHWKALEAKAALQGSSWTETKKRVFFIRVDFSDKIGAFSSKAALTKVLNTEVSNCIRDMSYGKTWIEADVSSVVVRLPNPSTTYVGKSNLLYNDAVAAFKALHTGINLSNYDIVSIHFKDIGMDFSGLATVGGSRQWIQGTNKVRTIVHELGHNYGLHHAHSWETTDGSVVGTGSTDEYGNNFDIMGSGRAPEGHFHPQAKHKLNWLGNNDWIDCSTQGSGTYRIYRCDDKATTGIRGLRVPKNNLNNYYWVSYRRAQPSNPYLLNGVVLNWEKNGTSWLLDTTPASPLGKKDSSILIGRTYSDTNAHVHITPVAHGGVAPNEWIDVTVNIGTFSSNHPPVATLSAPTTAEARTPLNFSVSATDPDNDTLAYSWDFGDGSIGNNQNAVTHHWDIGGNYTVRVTVSDMKGGTVTQSVNITVNDPLSQWTSGSVGFTNNMSEAAYINGRYILTGYRYAYFSIDGSSWSRSKLTFNHNPSGIAYGNGVYVITGKDYTNSTWTGTAFYSFDGKHWNKATVPSINKIYDVVFGGNRFVAVGKNGAIMYSLDGITWTAAPNIPNPPNFKSISYGNGEFIAVGDTKVFASSDGISWEDRSANTGLASWHKFYTIFFNNGVFYAGGWYSGIRYSSDQGRTWQKASIASTENYNIKKIYIHQGVFLALAIQQSDNKLVLLISSNGTSWSPNTPASLKNTDTLTFGNGVFFSTQDAGETQHSASFFPHNHPPTTSISGPSSTTARKVVQFTANSQDPDGDSLIHIWDFQDGTDLVTGPSVYHSFPTGGSHTVKLSVIDNKGGLTSDTFTVTVSDPLNTWTQRTSGTVSNFRDIALGGGKLVAIGSSGTYRVSTDAITWTGDSLPELNVSLFGITYDGSQFITVGKDYNFSSSSWVGVIYTSPDGTHWTRRYFAGHKLKDIAYGNGVLIATGYSGTILRSTDHGVTWSSIPSGVSTNLNGVSYGANTFVIVGANSSSTGATILKSNDGSQWTNTSSAAGTRQGFFHTEYLNNLFLASGFYTGMRFSTNGGTSFTTNQSENNYQSRGYAYGNALYFATVQDLDNNYTNVNLISTTGTHWTPFTPPTQKQQNAAIFFQNTFITVGENGNIWQSNPFSSPSGWAAWRATQFPNYPMHSDANEDFDNDGVPNLLEYITGTDPKSPTSYILPQVAIESNLATISLPKSPTATGFTLVIEASDDLKNWSTSDLTIITDSANLLKVRLNSSVSSSFISKKFFRAKAILTP